mgnify:FL=1
MTEMKVGAISPWFGGKRTLAPRVVTQLGKHTQYFEPFCGSMAVLLAKAPSQKETVSDLHGDLTNLAFVLQDTIAAETLYDLLQRTLFAEGLRDEAARKLEQPFDGLTEGPKNGCIPAWAVARAYWYFLACWMGRNGTAGTERQDYQIAVRWAKGGGSPTVRFRNATESIPAWHQRLRNVVILRRDAFQILDRFEDCAGTAIYVDSPYTIETRGDTGKSGAGARYLHEFAHTAAAPDLFEQGPAKKDDHQKLAEVLRGYKAARIVVSHYDCPRIRELYQGWTFVDCAMNKQLHAQNGRGARKKLAPEVLIINGP